MEWKRIQRRIRRLKGSTHKLICFLLLFYLVIASRIIDEGFAQGLLRQTVDKAIKNAKTVSSVEAMFEVRGIGSTALIVEMMGKSEADCKKNLSYLLKKSGGIIDKGIINMFDKKGVIVTKKTMSLDDAEELAIEIEGVEEVEESDDSLVFLCNAQRYSEIHKAVSEKLEVQESQIRYLPNVLTELTNKREKGLFLCMLNELEKHDDVMAVHHNADL